MPPTPAPGRPYERLQSWEACRHLVLAVYRASRAWPREERYGITAQARAAAVSALSSVAKGSARRGPTQFRSFLDVTVGSLAELGSLLHLAEDLGYLTPASSTELRILHDHANRLTWGLYRAMRRRCKDG